MPRIFISYRREDSADVTTHIHEYLDREFGRDNVFMDVDSLLAGADWVDDLHKAVRQCDVVLAVIGRNWLGERGLFRKRRIDQAGDFLRTEIEAALKHRVRVIPVLVGGAGMPPAPSTEGHSLADRSARRDNPDWP